MCHQLNQLNRHHRVHPNIFISSSINIVFQFHYVVQNFGLQHARKFRENRKKNHFCKSGFLIGREVRVEVQFCQKGEVRTYQKISTN